jgi:hypothetical protein
MAAVFMIIILNQPIAPGMMDGGTRIKQMVNKLNIFTLNDIRKFTFSYEINLLTKCWVWKKSLFHNGYGCISYKNNAYRAHRFSYEYFIGEIPKGIFVCHFCDNRKCVNPEHLFLGHPKDNSKDMLNKDRSAKGINHSQAKLTIEEVMKIKKMIAEGLRTLDIAKQFSISRQAITDIRYSRTWVHINEGNKL